MSARSIMARPHPFVKALATALRRRCGVPAGARVLVAVSGGADSVALLRGLAALAPTRPWRLHLAVGHVQHHLRGAAAERDARFVARLAQRLDLPFLRADLDLGDQAGRAEGQGPRAKGRKPKAAAQGHAAECGAQCGGAPPANLEARARLARYQALTAMADTCDAGFIAVAHHADDQLETLLMRLLRGASVRGLAGMAWRRGVSSFEFGVSSGGAQGQGPRAKGQGPAETDDAAAPVRTRNSKLETRNLAIIRPLLAVDRAAIRTFLTDQGQSWCEDHTNRQLVRVRARLRHEVLPVLRDLRPDAPHRAVALADHLRQMQRLLDDAVARAAERVQWEAGGATLDRVEARLLPGVVLAGLLRRLLLEAGVGADRLGGRHLGSILRAVRDRTGGQRRFACGGGARVVVERETVKVERA